MMLPSQYKNRLAYAVADAVAVLDREFSVDVKKMLEYPRAQMHGDLSCSCALALAKRIKKPPIEIAKRLTEVIDLPPFVCDMRVAAPGFVNFTIDNGAKAQVIGEILAAKEKYGIHPPVPQSVLLEFISANPTGPLHIGHGRACVYGDALANILAASGKEVRREYYINDAGRQMDILAASVWLRYWLMQPPQRETTIPLGAYRGDYLIAVAEALAPLLQITRPPDAALTAAMTNAATADAAADILLRAAQQAMGEEGDFPTLRKQLGDAVMDNIIKKDMQSLHLETEKINFFSEASLHQDGQVAAAVDALMQNDCLYEKEDATWFKSSAFGDEKDRVVRRSNGELTYFAADIAYHVNKLTRSRPAENSYKIINVLGADHHGYVPRLSAAIQALGFPADSMQVQIIQFVTLLEDGKRLKMSTRAGEFITVGELVEAVGTEAARYYYLNRKNDQHLDFDIAVARAQKRNNPVYYIHYANARIQRIMQRWEGDPAALADKPIDCLLSDNAAIQVCNTLMLYPEMVLRAAEECAPHLLTVYMHDLAVQLHNFYECTQVLPRAGEAADADTFARLALLQAVSIVLNNAAALLGLRLPAKMRD